VRTLVFVSGTLAFTLALTWLTWRTGQWLRSTELDFNPLLPMPELVGRLVMIGICLALGRLSGLPADVLGWTSADPLGDIGWGLGLGALAQVAINAVTRGAVRLWGWRVYSPLLMRSLLPRTPAEWVAVPLALLPGIFLEELLFRSLWVGGLSSLANPWLLALLMSIIYGGLHALQGPLGAVAAGGIGFGLAALFLWRGSLLAPLAAHVVYNCLQLWAAHRQREWLDSFDVARGEG
jgi:membrane protease YdiL (CAAX protease family)